MIQANETGSAEKQQGLKLGLFLFQPGISGGNVVTLIFAAFATMATITYVNFVQPFLLTEMLNIPAGRQGALTGALGALHEVAVILTMGVAGALSDRTGRRIVFVAGFLVLALGYLIYPLAGSEWQLFIFRQGWQAREG
ncbi:MAG: MFS transporter [Gammaproteobacteria bacterium]